MSTITRRILAPIAISLFVAFIDSGCSISAAQENGDTGGVQDTNGTTIDPQLKAKLGTPRACMRGFLNAMNRDDKLGALIYLDTTGWGTAALQATGESLTFKLKGLLDRMWEVNFSLLPDDEDHVGMISVGNFASDLKTAADILDADQIAIERGTDGLWRFSTSTVSQIDALWERWENRPLIAALESGQTTETFSLWLRRQFPDPWRKTQFVIPSYQWLCLLILIVIGFGLDTVTRMILNTLTTIWFRYVKTDVEYKVRRNLWKPVGLLAQACTWYFGARIIGLPANFLLVLLVALKFLFCVAAVWTAFRAIDVMSSLMMRKALKTPTRFDELLIPLVRKALKILATCVGIVIFIDIFDLNWKALLGGFGIGGAAIAFASKDVISNFFGSVTVLTDRPFEVGDWVVTEGVEGTVETVGMRSSRIRTFYNSIIVLPNSRLTTAIVDNMGRRRYRRIRAMLGLEYSTTPEQIDAFCEGVRELIRRHPYTRKDYYHVYFNEFGDSSLNVLLYCFLECPDWSVELREKHRLFADILRLAEKIHVGFAFPTRTLHMFSQDASDLPPAPDMENPSKIGQKAAAVIAGPPATGLTRPGRVKFSGPTLQPGEQDDEARDD